MIEQFKAAGAADERMKILERMMRGKNHKASELGKWVATGVPPYGYQKIGEKKEAKLTINETERAIVSRVYDMYLVHRGRNACRFFFSCRQRTTRISPFERLCHRLIEVRDEI